MKENPFNQQDIAVIKDFCERLGYDIVYFPGIDPANLNRHNVLPQEVYYRTFGSILSPSEKEAFLANYAYDVSPSSDNRPFFFHFFKWRQALYLWHSLGKTWQHFGGAGYLIIVALLVSAKLALVILILLPLYFQPGKKREPVRVLIQGVRWQSFIYFSALGIGFPFIEIPLMQKFILFLDQPAYAFAAVLFTIFIWSGLGSLFYTKLAILPHIIFGLGVLSLLYSVLLPFFFEGMLGQPLILRLLATSLALAPPGLLMGIPFPSGIKVLGSLSPDLIPWAWAINGCVSVVSSIVSLMIALSVGFSWVLIGAGCAYLIGGAVAVSWVWKIKKGLNGTRGLPNARLT